MPELPEVETVRRGLFPLLVGRRLSRVWVRRPDLRRPLPVDLAARLEGARVVDLGRRAKYLIATLEDGPRVLLHLGMSGRLTLGPRAQAGDPGVHDHVLIDTDDDQRLVFHDPRRFGLIALAEPGEESPLLAGLGPEPLDPAFDGPALARRLAGRRGPLKTVLLDQRVIAGLGNIYVCEALYRAGLSPLRPAESLDAPEAARLVAAIRAVLEDALAAGGASLRDYRHVDGSSGYFQLNVSVYGKEGQPCPTCDCPAGEGGIRRLIQAGRSTFFCPRRQG
ncbi:bifunctional DNA-formamidopyrimidine glycosylase/DNA-(apurinic or apyrimidinic site) lyase [Pararhodospirillum oryzae]|uniref:Formamidopyrimidine-DNA glycosylase n=1 Tax=Pararhodospirillum oryzae TaxID=478448 RepID=A0A512H609_9PROT|nr:bifunctional DNA-formamidopyrimidine glycosylase/DNA-(apurinic or apyrimidinic site) lyase [Pararhodospirillum oryzae]GEO80883.1 formamidopyrimidine-DNA glycosylase [Pararhodospirillum oryzae]